MKLDTDSFKCMKNQRNILGKLVNRKTVQNISGQQQIQKEENRISSRLLEQMDKEGFYLGSLVQGNVSK